MHALLLLALAAPSADLIDVDGPELLTEVKRSKEDLVVLNVWATWCGPCVAELPMFFEVEKELAGRARFLYVSTDFTAQREDAAKFMKSHGAHLPSYFKRGKDQAFIETLHPRWNGSLPATFIFDRSGKVLRFWIGSLERRELSGAITNLLKK